MSSSQKESVAVNSSSSEDEQLNKGSAVRQCAKKKKEYKTRLGGVLRVTGLPSILIESDLQQFFEQFGPVTRLVLLRSKRTTNSKGIALVEFQNPRDAATIANELKTYITFGKTIRFKHLADLNREDTERLMHSAGRKWVRVNRSAKINKVLAEVANKDQKERLRAKMAKCKELFEKKGLKFNLEA